ncbi:TIGR02444 family protein [Mycolicibacterium arenosum]|uniref:TIGR02444 family protein n=1 Tax=Mycolicibacterium arenosum TaxID=2952157 RepID=A0ABT1M091_9MYCO|nr:TIGR02444 family protein [Mycolicibacterium sp. CAU 1645]MCP9272581.1 TIGR02444 family protein [Mycolicibacterium sp. CAU 1645]
MSAAESGFQRFALAIYEEDGVSPATLLIQNRCDVDVNVLLFAAYVGAVRGCAVHDDDVAAAADRVGSWQREIVAPLRAVRTRLKAGPPPAPSTATAQFRDRVKALELDAELIELAELDSFLAGHALTPVSGTPAERAVAAMTAVTSDTGGTEVRDAMSVIATAAAAYGGPG